MKPVSKKLTGSLILLITFFSSLNVYAANYYWVGGTGSWSDYSNHWATTSGGVIFNTTTPGPLDDVYFDANSFAAANDTIFLDSTLVYCKNMSWSGSTNNPVLKSNIVNSVINIYGSMTLIAAMKFSNSDLRFASNVPGNVITSAGNTLGRIIFDGTGGWILFDALHTAYIFMSQGVFNTGNQMVTCAGNFEFDNISGLPMTVQLGYSLVQCYDWIMLPNNITLLAASSTIQCQNHFSCYTAQVFNNVTARNLDVIICTFNYITINQVGKLYAESATIQRILFNDDGEIYGSGNTIHSAEFLKNASISGVNTFDSLLFAAGSKVELADTQKVSNLLSASGSCAGITSIIGKGTIRKTTGSVLLNYVMLKNINTAGGASFTANNSIGIGNNSGWTINSSAQATLYWTGGTGNWSDASHWSASSGGSGGTCIPGPNDHVIFDAGSFSSANDTVYMNREFAYCRNMNWTGALNNPVFKSTDPNSEINIYGSLTLIAAMKFSGGNLRFGSASAGNTITTAGNTLSGLIFDGSGSWICSDALQALFIFFIQGGLNTNNQSVSCSNTISCDAYSSLVISIQLGTSVVNCFNWHVPTSNVTVSAASSFIVCVNNFSVQTPQVYNNVTSHSVYLIGCTMNNLSLDQNGSLYAENTIIQRAVFNGDGELNGTFNNIHYAEFMEDASVGGNNIFDSLLFAPGSKVQLDDMQTINNHLSASGSCIGVTAILGPGILRKTSGAVVLDYVVLKDISSTGGASFTANNSKGIGNNSGWTLNSAPQSTLYWTGGTGNWSDVSHWSSTSGGAGGSCIPGPNDNAVFDANSFSSANQTVFLDKELSYCRNMDWTGSLYNPALISNITNSVINIYGSITLITAMNFSNSEIVFGSDVTGNTITTSGNYITGIIFDGPGSWILADSMNTGFIFISQGELNTNNQPVITGNFICDDNASQVITIQLGTSAIKCNSWIMTLNNLVLSAAASNIICMDNFSVYTAQVFNSITTRTLNIYDGFINDLTITEHGSLNAENTVIQHAVFNDDCEINGSNITMQYARFALNGSISGDHIFDTLVFSGPGSQVAIVGTETINNSLWTNAMPGFPISMNGPGTVISSSGNTFCLDYLYLQDITATGGAGFFAGGHSVDLGGNSGWTWTSCTPDTSNVWPGDANYDLVADNIDILYIGLAYGYTGPVRAGATINWVAQPGIDWLQQFATGYNIKHADCDGNGIVNTVDTNAVILNYGQVHPFKQSGPPTVTNFGTPLYFDFPPGALIPGSTVDIPIMFGTSNEQADKFYGVAFTVNYDPSLIQSGTMEITFSNTWFGNGANTIHINKDFFNNGMIDMAFVKIDHADEAGFGQFATLHFTLANNASGPLNLSFSKILVLDKFEIPQPVNVINGSVYTGVNDISSSGAISVYPNPAQDMLQIDVPNQTIREIKLINTAGQTVLYTDHSGSARLDVSGMANGVYLVEIKTGNGILRRKIIVSH